MAWISGVTTAAFVVACLGAGSSPAEGTAVMTTEESGTPRAEEPAAVPGELLVKFAEMLSDEEIARITDRLGVEVVDRLSGGRLLLVRVPYPSVSEDIRSAFEANPGVVYAEPNYTYGIEPPELMEGDGDTPPADDGGGPGISIPDSPDAE